MRFRAIASLLCVSAIGAAPGPSVTEVELEVVGIRAQLYYPGTGTFSRDVLAAPRFSLWNVIIGEGDADSPSDATLVTVEVKGPPNRFADSTFVRLRAVAVDQVLVNRAIQLTQFGPTGSQFVAFWLYDTGCDPIELVVSVGDAAPARRARIPFECGE